MKAGRNNKELAHPCTRIWRRLDVAIPENL